MKCLAALAFGHDRNLGRRFAGIALAAGLCLPALASNAGAGEVSFVLDSPDLAKFYPNAADPSLPAYYAQQPDFPKTLQASIYQFTSSSLSNDGFTLGADVTLDVTVQDGSATITLSASDPAVLAKVAGYKTVLQQFTDAGHGGLGLIGAQQCQAATGCWDPAATMPPWAFYLPLGLPLVNQQAAMLLNYPPGDALCSADYLNNFTMARWTAVLQRVGITDPVLFENIVDVHPIAAPGSKQSGYIRNTTGYFFKAGQPNYDQAMIDLALIPPGRTGPTTLPLQVAGSDALAVWASMIGRPFVAPGEVGTFTPVTGPSIPWVATNHPDVTTYQHCKGDPGKSKTAQSGDDTDLISLRGSSAAQDYTDDALVADELLDLQAACTLKALAESPGLSPEDAMAQCKQVWCTEDNGICLRRQVCIQARLDYDFGAGSGQCKCEAAAEAFCNANANNACPSETQAVSCSQFNGLCDSPAPSYRRCTTPS